MGELNERDDRFEAFLSDYIFAFEGLATLKYTGALYDLCKELDPFVFLRAFSYGGEHVLQRVRCDGLIEDVRRRYWLPSISETECIEARKLVLEKAFRMIDEGRAQICHRFCFYDVVRVDDDRGYEWWVSGRKKSVFSKWWETKRWYGYIEGLHPDVEKAGAAIYALRRRMKSLRTDNARQEPLCVNIVVG